MVKGEREGVCKPKDLGLYTRPSPFVDGGLRLTNVAMRLTSNSNSTVTLMTSAETE